MIFIHPGFKDVARAQHGNGTVVVGSPGSGKSAIIFPWMRDLAKGGAKIISLDVKGEQFERFGFAYFEPWREGSLYHDIASDVDGDSGAAELSNVLVPVDESDKNKVWQAAANAVAEALILDLTTEKPGAWDYSDLADKLDLPMEKWLELMHQHAPQNAKILEGAEQTSASVAFNVATSLKDLRRVANMFAEVKKFGGKPFSVRRWLTEKDYPTRQVILRFNRGYEKVIGFLFPFLIEYIARRLSGLPNNLDDPKNIILDEFPQLPVIPSLRELYEHGRSKGFNLLLAAQDWDQVRERYGDKIGKILFSNASVRVICRTAASEARDMLAAMIGSQDVASVNISHSSGGGSHGSTPSTSTTLASTTRPLVLSTELTSALGPHSFIENPVPGKDPIPQKFRALLLPISGNVFRLDWPLADLPERFKRRPLLPSQRAGASNLRACFRDKSAPFAERVRRATRLAGLPISWRDLAELLYSDGLMTAAEWSACATKATTFREAVAATARRIDAASASAATPDIEAGPSQEAAAMATQAAPEQQADDFNLDELMGFTAQPESAPALRFEGMQERDSAAPGALGHAAAELAHVAEVVGHVLPHAAEAAHGLTLAAHAIEAIELLTPKCEPEPIMTATTPSDADGDAAKASPLLARLAAKKRSQMTPN